MDPAISSPPSTPAFIHSLTSICLISYRDDLDIQTALMLLAPMTQLDTLAVFTVQHDIKESVFLEAVTRHVPRIEVVVLRQVNLMAAQISQGDILEIATSLEKLPRLRILDLGVNVEAEHDDVATIKLWSGACKSVSSIVLHGRVWERMNDRWTNCALLPASYV
ncbi:hypothetical protein MSAN_00245600 [Mycena sanguinolenta]|uniref:Uncharacterized protein n=1 Tax=Mycena sanguinolenta TaxID=230812 RepID=A0A8H6ZIM2_9AGAR|nr:hypothetical protein MSAN_00245600 [Mycena sanguinolenta]